MTPSPGLSVGMRARQRYRQFLFRIISIGGALVACRLMAAEADLGLPEQTEKVPSNWLNSYEVRGWSGYKDNVLLSNFNVVGSPLLGIGTDLTFFRLPIDNWEVSILASGEYIRYLDAPSKAEQEATVILQGQVKRSFAEVWKAGLSAEYMFFDQVFDGSSFAEVLVPVPIQGNSLTLRPSVSRALGSSARLELEFPVNRQLFDDYIDDFWEVGPKLAFTKTVGKKSEFTVSYQFAERLHDTRDALDGQGGVLTDEALVYYEHEWAASWRQYWDEGRHWRTTTKFGVWRNDDNGGFYRYWRPQVSEQLRYQAKSWEIKLDARVSYYNYDNERIGDLSSDLREKTYLRLGLRGEKTLVKSLRVFGQYDYERAYSNLEFDRYTANTISVGVNWEF